MNSHLDEELCFSLLLDDLPEEQAEEALKHLGECPTCEDLFRRRAIELERLWAEPCPLALKKYPWSPGPSHTSTVVPLGRWRQGWTWFRTPAALLPAGGLAAALLVSVLLLIVIPRGGQHPDDLSLHWLPEAVDLVPVRGEGEVLDSSELLTGLAAYNRRDLSEAVRHLKAARVNAETDRIRALYLGSALALSGDYASAVVQLRSMPADWLPEPLRTEERWTLLVSLRRAGLRKSADSLLSNLKTEPGEIGARARRAAGSR
jgi:hypothetical protein